MDHLIINDSHVLALLQKMHNHSYMWREIGIALRFTEPELQIIQSTPALLNKAPFSFLEYLMNQWVQWPTDDHESEPTLEKLCTALKSSLVGLGRLAKEIENTLLQERTGEFVDS